jgi:uncharacterized membrane protein
MATEPELERAVKHIGNRSAYMDVLVGLAGNVVLDEKSRNIIFGEVLGNMSAEVASRTARPWQYLVALLLGMVFALVLYINNIMLQIALGII